MEELNWGEKKKIKAIFSHHQRKSKKCWFVVLWLYGYRYTSKVQIKHRGEAGK